MFRRKAAAILLHFPEGLLTNRQKRGDGERQVFSSVSHWLLKCPTSPLRMLLSELWVTEAVVLVAVFPLRKCWFQNGGAIKPRHSVILNPLFLSY